MRHFLLNCVFGTRIKLRFRSILRELFLRNFPNCWDNILLIFTSQNKRNVVPENRFSEIFGGYFLAILVHFIKNHKNSNVLCKIFHISK